MSETEQTPGFLAELRTRNGYELARLADCGTPTDPTTAGYAFLTATAEAVAERIEFELGANGNAGNLAEAVRVLRDGGGDHEIADGAPDVYTATRWAEFVDLAAWQEDLTEYGPINSDDPEGVTKTVAGVALYVIARRLVDALLTEAEDASDDEDDDED